MSNFLGDFITNHINPTFKDEIVNKSVKASMPRLNEKFNYEFGKLKEQVVKELIDEFGANVVKEVHVIQLPDKANTLTEITHEKFDTVLKLVSNDLPVFLAGAAGTGKNVICKQVAKALDLEFYFTNAVTQEYKLTGFIDAMGNYHETEFYRAFKNGGVFFLDEMDASIPEVLVALNAAIANRYFEFPTGKIDANPNFRIIAAGNTFGGGSNAVYTGRYRLDGASLDRFSVVEVDYSPKIEAFVTNGNSQLVDFCHQFRDTVKKANIDCIFSYRGLNAITKLEASGMPLAQIFKIALTKGLSNDDISTLKVGFYGNNKYVRAFKDL